MLANVATSRVVSSLRCFRAALLVGAFAVSATTNLHASVLELHDCSGISKVAHEFDPSEEIHLLVQLQGTDLEKVGDTDTRAARYFLAGPEGKEIQGEPLAELESGKGFIFRTLNAGSWKFCPYDGASFSATVISATDISRGRSPSLKASSSQSLLVAGALGTVGVGAAILGASSGSSGGSDSSSSLGSSQPLDAMLGSTPNSEVAPGRSPSSSAAANSDDCFNGLSPDPVSPFL